MGGGCPQESWQGGKAGGGGARAGAGPQESWQGGKAGGGAWKWGEIIAPSLSVTFGRSITPCSPPYLP